MTPTKLNWQALSPKGKNMLVTAHVLTHLNRQTKTLIQLFLDFLSLGVALATLLFFVGDTTEVSNPQSYGLIYIGTALAIMPMHLLIGTYKTPIRYLQTVIWIKLSVAVISIAMILMFFLFRLNIYFSIIQWAFFIFTLFSLMLGWRVMSWAVFFSTNLITAKEKVAIFGVNVNSRQLLSMVRASENFQATFFIEHSENLEGVKVDGLTVISLEKFIHAANEHKTKLVLIDFEKCPPP